MQSAIKESTRRICESVKNLGRDESATWYTAELLRHYQRRKAGRIWKRVTLKELAFFSRRNAAPAANIPFGHIPDPSVGNRAMPRRHLRAEGPGRFPLVHASHRECLTTRRLTVSRAPCGFFDRHALGTRWVQSRFAMPSLLVRRSPTLRLTQGSAFESHNHLA